MLMYFYFVAMYQKKSLPWDYILLMVNVFITYADL